MIRFQEWARYFLVIQSVRTALGINLASCAVGTWDLCPVGEVAGVRSWPLPCSAEVKECVELTLHSPMCIHGLMK